MSEPVSLQEVIEANAAAPKVTVDDARSIIEQQRKERIARCQEKIRKALEDEGCSMEASFVLTPPNSIESVIRIVARD